MKRARIPSRAGASIAALAFLLSPIPAQAEGADPQTMVVQFKDTLNQAKLSLIDVSSKKGSDKTNAKREVLGLLSKAWILLQRIPATVQDKEQLDEDKRFVEDNLKDLGALLWRKHKVRFDARRLGGREPLAFVRAIPSGVAVRAPSAAVVVRPT